MARYRRRAAECSASARRAASASEQALWLKLADDWLALAGDVAGRVEFWTERAREMARHPEPDHAPARPQPFDAERFSRIDHAPEPRPELKPVLASLPYLPATISPTAGGSKQALRAWPDRSIRVIKSLPAARA